MRYLPLAILPVFSCLIPAIVRAQVTSDGTLGTQVNASLLAPCSSGTCIITGGTTDSTGKNLFHSFETFSLPSGVTAYFNNAASVQNIFSRVTGTAASNIDGTIKANAPANVFLINANGMIFGANGSLDLGGAFAATTASAIQFGSLGTFGANTGNNVSLLSVNPSAFLFNQAATPAIASQANLQVPAGASLLLAGGDINITGGKLAAPGGRVELSGLATAGSIDLNLAGSSFSLVNSAPTANVSLNNGAQVDVRSNGGGSIAISAKNLQMLGNSKLQAGIASGTAAIAAAGNIEINASDTFTVANDSLAINDLAIGATGNSGSININTGSLLVNSGGLISSSIFGIGQAGSININTKDSVLIDGSSNNGFSSGIYTAVLPTGIGNGGNINLAARSLFISNGGELQATTLGQGNAGNINLQIQETITFDGVSSTQSAAADGINSGYLPSGAFSAVGKAASGNGGNINISTQSLFVNNGGAIAASSFGQGNAGNINISASDLINFKGTGQTVAGLQDLDALKLANTLTDLTYYGGAFSAVALGATGNAGSINIAARSLLINDSAGLSVSNTGGGNGGTVQIQVQDMLALDNQGFIMARTFSGEGGNINLQTNGVLVMRHSSIISASTASNSNGGNIQIFSPFIFAIPIENSDITANAVRGRGGNISITTLGVFGLQFNQFLTDKSDITANSLFGTSGNITITNLQFDPRQGLTKLPSNTLRLERLSDNACAAGTQAGSNRFAIVGKGGLPANPFEAIASDTLTLNWLNLPHLEATAAPDRRNFVASDRPLLIEAQSIKLGANGEIILAAAVPVSLPALSCPAKTREPLSLR